MFQIQGLITLNNDSYNPQPWHGTLLVIAVVIFAIIFNTSMAKQLPMVQVVILVIHILGLFAIIIPLWVMAPSRNSGRVALLDFYNGGNWSTVGLATMIGLLTPLGSMLGFDCAVHMCRIPHLGLRSIMRQLTDYSRRDQRRFRHPSKIYLLGCRPQCHPWIPGSLHTLLHNN